MADTSIILTAVDRTASAFASASKNLMSLGERALSVNGILGGLGVSLSAGAVFAWTRGIAEGIDRLNDLKDATGSSIENLSALEDLAARTGTAFDTVGTAITKFNAILKDAKPGSDAEAVLKALNLDVRELQSLDPAEALRRTAVALAAFADDGNKARAVQELFGKSVREVAPFLKDLAEAGKLNATVTTAQADEAERFSKDLSALKKNFEDLERSIAGPVIRTFNDLADKIRKAREEGNFLFSSMEKEAAKYEARRSANLTGTWYIAGAGRGAVNPPTVQPQDGRPSVGPLPDKAVKPVAEKAEHFRAETNALETYVRSLERAVERTQDLSEVEVARLRIGESLSRTSSVLLQQRALDLAAQKDAAKLQEEENRARDRNNQQALAAVEALASENEAIINSNKSLSDQIEEMGLNAQALQALRLARLDAAIAADRELLVTRQNIEGGEAEAAQIERRINLRLRERDLVQKQGDRQVKLDADKLSEDAAKTLNSDVKSALSAAFRDSKNPVTAFANGLGNVIYTRMTNSLASALADGLVGTGAPGSSGGLLGGFVSSLFSWLPKFDTGIGYVPFDMPAIIHKGERVLTAEENRRGAGFSPSTSIVVQGGGNSGEIYANVSKALDARDREWSERLKAAGVF